MAQLGARYLGVVEAASSSLVTQTSVSVHYKSDERSHFLFLRQKHRIVILYVS